MNQRIVAGALTVATSVAAAIASAGGQTFRSRTEIVEVDVIVRDAEGWFIRGLTRDDFVLRESGQPQQIDTVYLVDGAAAARRPDLAAAPAPPQKDPSRVFVLLFDQQHLSAGALGRLQGAAESFVRDQFRDGDIGGVVADGRMVDDRMTRRGEELLEAVRTAKISSERVSRFFDLNDWPRFLSEVEAYRVERGDADAVRQVIARAAADEDDGRGRLDIEGVVRNKAARLMAQVRAASNQTLRTLDALATGLQKLPGRKTVLFLTEGFFAEEGRGRLDEIIGRAARARVAVYSIDARGLERTAAGGDVRSGAFPQNDMTSLAAFDTWRDAPNSLAVDSGGLALRNTNDFRGLFAQVAADTSTYYVLAYSPSTPPDGKFRPIEVAVGRPGITVRARKGYLAIPTNVTPPPSAEAPPRAFNVADAPVVRAYLERLRARHPPLAPAVDLMVKGAATEALGALPASEKNSSPAVFLEGLAYFTLRNQAGAAAALTRAAEGAGADAMPFFVLGWMHAAAGLDQEAVGAFRKAVLAEPGFLQAHLALSDAYLRLSQPALASQALRAGLAALPGSPAMQKRLNAIERREP